MHTFATAHESEAVATTAVQRWARRAVLKRLARISRGQLKVTDPLGTTRISGNSRVSTGTPEVQATLHVLDPSFYTQLALGGSLGAAESYLDGKWQTESLVDLFRLFVRNPELNTGVEKGWARLAGPWRKLRYRMRRNTRAGSRKNISDHYDLSNDLFEQFLDPTMSYSSVMYQRPEATLETAAVHKLDEVCRKLDLSSTDHLLEIGTGWGGLAIHAARTTGCRVTTTTISKEQHDLAVARVDAAGLAERVEVLLADYRDLDGSYDKLVSIEMIEAVGAEYYRDYFRQCSKLLKEDGLALIQAITISDRLFEEARYEVDFIKKYIFPGSCIPSVGSLTQAICKGSDFDVVDMDDIGAHYALTLRDWRKRFLARRHEVAALGFDERFMRMWEFYLTYCEAGFVERQIRDFQILLAKPFNRRAPLHWDALSVGND